MDIAEARGLLVGVRKLQINAKRLRRRGILVWDWAGALEYGYLGGDSISFLGDMALLRQRFFSG